jgi:hypothetical protein
MDREAENPPVIEQVYGKPIVGGLDVPAGFWAGVIRRKEWGRGQYLRERPGTVLNRTKQMPFLREPTIKKQNRLKKEWPMSGQAFFDLIKPKSANVEATEAQAKGVPFEHPCGNCNVGHGVFPAAYKSLGRITVSTAIWGRGG